LWQELRTEDAAVALLAMQKLARDPAGVVPLVRDRVRVVDGKAITKWLGELDDRDFKVRDAAFQGLARLGGFAEGPLRKALDSKPPLEKHRRIEELLNKMTAAPATAEHRRAVRAVEVLEMIGTPEARRVLEPLAAGDPDAVLTRAAKAALERLKK
jgi:HEAT repeat protein